VARAEAYLHATQYCFDCNMTFHCTKLVHQLIITVAHVSLSDSGRLYILAVFYLFLFPTTDFQRPWTDFCETFPHDAACPEIFHLLYGGSHVPLKHLRSKNPQFLPICGPKIDTLSPAIPYCGENQKSKTIGSICGYVRTSILNMVGVPPPHLRNRLSPRCVGWGR